MTNFQFLIHADRLCRQVGQLPVISRRGLPSAASEWFEVSQHDWSHWDAVPCVSLLGEPGSGKTSEFVHRFSQLNESGHVAFMSRWQDWCDGDDIFATLNDPKGFHTALNAGQTVWWFIDALDEGRIKTERAFDVIKKGLRKLNDNGMLERIKLRISCRSRDWRPTELSQLISYFPDTKSGDETTSGVVALQLLPLDEVAVRTLAKEKLGTQIAVDQFMNALARRHVFPLAGQPLLLAMMLQLFQHGDETLGRDRTGLYKQAIDNLNAEHNSERKDQAPPHTMPANRIAIAKKMAVHAVFGGKDAIAVPDMDSKNDRTLDAACSESGRKEILETLNTGLFTQHVTHGFSFYHRSFAEFMAAEALSDQLKAGLPLGRILPLFPIEHEVIPGPLRETAAWLAGLDAHFRNWLITHDPITAAQGDTVRYSAAEREKLITTLATRFGKRTWQRDFDRFGDLARSVADNVLQQLLQPGISTAVRLMVMEMIDAAEVEPLFPALLQIASDSNTESTLRTKAATILARRAPDNYADKLLPLLYLPADLDRDDETCGALLYHLYPHFLSTEQALRALHIPHNHFFTGMYALFWSDNFIEQISADRSDRQLTLDAIVPLLNDDGDSIALRVITEIFTKLLQKELNEEDQDITKLGSWLIKLAGWVRHHGTNNETEHQKLIQKLRELPKLRATLFNWQLKNWPDGKDFNPWWHFPFYDSITSGDDVAIFIDLCREYSGSPEIGKRIFNLLVGLAYHPPFSVRLETLEALAASNIHYDSLWQEIRVNSLDGQIAKIHREQQESKAKRTNRQAEDFSSVQSNIEVLRTGNYNFILNVMHTVSSGIFGEAPLEAIKGKYGEGVAQAVHEGLVKTWDDLNNTSHFWPYSNTLPNIAIAAEFGYRLKRPQLSTLNQYQVDCLIWSMLHHNNDNSTLLIDLWIHHRQAVWQRILETIKQESTASEESHPRVWQFLNSFDDLPSGLMDELVNYVIKEGIPFQTRARQYALRILFRSSQRKEVLQLVATLVNAEWQGQTLPAPWFEYAALSASAAWWLLDADSAFHVLENYVFQGSRHSQRAIGFINGLQELQNNYSAFNSTWPESVSWQNYAKLLPLLYAHPPHTERKLGGGVVTPSDQFAHARDSLVSYISNAPPALASAWFGAWKDDMRYGGHRDWFATIDAELIQKQADESWSPLTIEAVNQVIVEQAFLVRNDNDLMLMLNELIERELIPAFRSDYNLVPLLWSGTKDSGNRKHLDEPALQTAIFGQLIPIVRARRIIGAREPEVLDAKKPDVRLTFVLDSGLIVDIPVEVKWGDHAKLWSAIENQLLKKYMQDPRVRYGIYLVGWAGPTEIQRGPNSEKPADPLLLQSQLQKIADLRLAGTHKKITVYVVDASVLD
ncbi:hypothetical protein NTGBS_1140001 [Candidatus Nitrotoga sp. BS]|uniref:NACHT domain-containing protein n=1 Tax=Candidatus Nitrotoga sp. BS TaxID=2890408 RepID=UPI001EF2A609|nr:hypothetical protein [Candidatus Nitrotoga sp. BS]CAH1190159.1 hypothetical protein NTGBS_1140001 [Candidatus Nitrotoga sp. BS]